MVKKATAKKATAKRSTSSGRGGPPNPVDIHVGNRIRAIRKLSGKDGKGIGQQDFAKLLGVTFQQVQKYEKGHNRISCSRLYDIANVLGVTPNFFYEDMPKDVEQSSPRQKAGITGTAVDKPNKTSVNDPSSGDYVAMDLSTEEMMLLRNYRNLRADRLKAQIYDLCSELSKENVGRKPGKGKKTS